MNNFIKMLYLFLLLLILIIIISYLLKIFKPKKPNENSKLSKKISRRQPSSLQNKHKELNVRMILYEPSFKLQENPNNFDVEFSKGFVKFNLLNNLNFNNKQKGSVISKKKYKNISSIQCTFDLTHLSNLNYINTSFYLVNDRNDSKITLLETNGNKVFQSYADLNNSNSQDLNNWNFALTNLVNLVDPTSSPFQIKLEFIYGESPKILITAIQNDESGIIYEQKVNNDEIQNLMSDGYWLVSSFSQKYTPSNKNDFNLNIPSWEISDIIIKGQQCN